MERIHLSIQMRYCSTISVTTSFLAPPCPDPFRHCLHYKIVMEQNTYGIIPFPFRFTHLTEASRLFVYLPTNLIWL
jgi:hypothetical protein